MKYLKFTNQNVFIKFYFQLYFNVLANNYVFIGDISKDLFLSCYGDIGIENILFGLKFKEFTFVFFITLFLK